jgi:hypothetical protein
VFQREQGPCVGYDRVLRQRWLHHRVQPVTQLRIQVVEIAKGPGQEEVLADIAEWPLDLARGFGAIRPASLGMEP